MPESAAIFGVGEIVHHNRFDYRGVIVDVDPEFDMDEEWYEKMAKGRPPKDRPWYHVLVHDAVHMTYVAERNLRHVEDPEPIRHPMIEEYFESFSAGRYRPMVALN
ncbi:MAG: heat shock protein HspQ [Candidatus Binatia bacterium]|nr:heat shock protein HspQ [Candidatus Binatia bacterium]MDG1958446.1 heat shock protein HspQ [Candidatus Binatia bacterium]MDG2011329.1 heat shock protein HspQ [Candidatus Binatia bacterium]HAC79881.1 heat shock protein HspQ [Deltaproteobacteria bacterium]